MKPIKILIADDQPIFREGLAIILADQKDLIVVGKAKNGFEAVQLVKDCHPDVVLLDIQMPVLNGLESLVTIKEHYPDTGVIILTTFVDNEYIYEALCKGASGYVLKDIEVEQLVISIRQCVQGQMIFPASLQTILMAKMEMATSSIPNSLIFKEELQKYDYSFNEREYALMDYLSKGRTNQQIADELFLSLGTVKNYISQLYRKMNVSNRHELMVLLHRMGKDHVV